MKSRKRLSVHMSHRSLPSPFFKISIFCCVIVKFKEKDGAICDSISTVVFFALVEFRFLCEFSGNLI